MDLGTAKAAHPTRPCRDWIAAATVAGLARRVFGAVAVGESFFQALRESYGVEPAATERLIDVGFLSPDERRHLDLPSSQPVYRIEKTVYAPGGEAVSWSRLVTPTNLVTFSLWTETPRAPG